MDRTEFLRSLRGRGSSGIRPVIADHHSGLVKAVRKVVLGAGYQRCRVHFLRNTFAVIPTDSGELVAATIRTILAQPTAEPVRIRLDAVADMLARQFPKVSAMLLEAKEDPTAFADFPEHHWKKIRSTDPPERLNREIKRRTDVVRIFPKSDTYGRCGASGGSSGRPRRGALDGSDRQNGPARAAGAVDRTGADPAPTDLGAAEARRVVMGDSFMRALGESSERKREQCS